jgi:hypothetical protein
VNDVLICHRPLLLFLSPISLYCCSGCLYFPCNARFYLRCDCFDRFMQNQPDLVHLGKARLQLFEHFFLKSLKAQSSTNFVCIIRTDPHLHPSLKQPLIEMLRQSKLKHLLIASNETPKSQYHDIIKGRVEPSMVWSGDLDAIKAYLGLPPPETVEEAETPMKGDRAQDTQEGHRRLSMRNPEDRFVIVDKDDDDTSGGGNDNGAEDDRHQGGNDSASASLSLGPPPRILETRLDADDALHQFFVETLQALAVGDESSSSVAATDKGEGGNKEDAASEGEVGFDFAPLTWRIWCVDNHAEWQYQTAWKDPTPQEIEENVGSLISIAVTYCITPGLSIAFLGQDESIAAMPSTSKHERLMHIQQCTDGPMEKLASKEHKRFRRLGPAVGPNVTSNCRSFLPMAMAALRARTPTSAGMLNVVYNGTSFNSKYLQGAEKQRAIQDRMWYVVKRLFGFSKRNARAINRYMGDHMKVIAEENLLGQCTPGHSCKTSSQILLKSIVEGGGAPAGAVGAAAPSLPP